MSPYRAPIAEVVHVRCGYGGSGVSPPGHYGVMPDFSLTASRAIRGLRMIAFVVEGVASARPPIELRIWLPGRDRDHNEITKPFDGTVAEGATLRLRAFAQLTPVGPSIKLDRLPYRAALVTDDGTEIELTGVLDAPWATA